MLRKLIERLDFIPLEYLGKFELEVRGSLPALPALLGVGPFQTQKTPQL